MDYSWSKILWEKECTFGDARALNISLMSIAELVQYTRYTVTLPRLNVLSLVISEVLVSKNYCTVSSVGPEVELRFCPKNGSYL